MQRVMDEEKINRLIDAILVMQEQEDTITPALKTPLQSELLGVGHSGVFLFPLYFQCFHALLGAKHLRRENGNRIKSDRKT